MAEAGKSKQSKAEKTGSLQPWRTVWREPRRTIRFMAKQYPYFMTTRLLLLAGVAQAFKLIAGIQIPDTAQLWMILLYIGMAGVLLGLFVQHIGARLLFYTGRYLKGKAALPEIQSACAWGSVPIGLSLWLALPLLAAFGRDLFSAELLTSVQTSSTLLSVYGICSFLNAGLTVWGLTIILYGLAEVQQFSLFKAAASASVAVVLLLIPFSLMLTLLR